MDNVLFKTAVAKFRDQFESVPTVAAFAPGRIEVLGNHTDYNEGFVLSAAINLGICFLAAPVKGKTCRLAAANLAQETQFKANSPAPAQEHPWANYVKGVLAGISARQPVKTGFNGLFLSDIPMAAGLSSSAALEMSAGLALAKLYGMDIPKLELARIGQKAEHEFVGVKCGLMDQITSLSGKEDGLVMTDFRSLEVRDIPLRGGTADEKPCFVVCNTGVKHTLVDSEYNERRTRCEEASLFFKSALSHPVAALRDVSWKEWKDLSPRMDPTAARRAAHIIGENARVVQGAELLAGGRLRKFGELMFESHDSSRKYFENSCPELDFIVETAMAMPSVFGARLSGGGFGGCAIVLTGECTADSTASAVSGAFKNKFESPCTCRTVRPSGGARIIDVSSGQDL
ncbi:MAG: galactokinase [bacterium]